MRFFSLRNVLYLKIFLFDILQGKLLNISVIYKPEPEVYRVMSVERD